MCLLILNSNKFIFSRLFFLAGVAINTSSAFLSINDRDQFGPLLYICSIYSMTILICSAVIIFLGRRFSKHWSPFYTTLTLVFLIVGRNIRICIYVYVLIYVYIYMYLKWFTYTKKKYIRKVLVSFLDFTIFTISNHK